MRIILMFAVLLLPTPAWAVPTLPVHWGVVSVHDTHDYMPFVRLSGFPLDGSPGGVSDVFLKPACFFCDSFYVPTSLAVFFPNDLNVVRDISATGSFGLDDNRFGGPWVAWAIVADPFIARPGLVTTPFSITGDVFDDESPETYRYSFSGVGTATLSFGSPSPSGRGFTHDIYYTLAGSYSPPVPMPEPGTWALLASGLILVWLWTTWAAVREGPVVRDS